MSQVKPIIKEIKDVKEIKTDIKNNSEIKLIKNKTNLLGYNFETVLKTIFNVDD